MGYLVAALRDRGVEAYGIDISNYAISRVREDVKQYCVVGSLSEPINHVVLPDKYDLITSVEVLEHMSEEDGKKAIAALCSMTDRVIFTSSPDDFAEPTHINVQQREYWASVFAENGFADDLSYRPTYLTEHAVSFKRSSDWMKQLESYEQHIAKTDRMIKENNESWHKVVEEKELHICKQTEMLEQTMKNYQNLEDSYRKDIASFNHQISRLQENNAQAQLQTSREMSGLAKKMAEMAQNYASILEENTKTADENAALRNRTEAQEKSIDRLENVQKELSRKLKDVTDEKTQLSNELSTYKEHYQLIITQKDDLANQLVHIR